MPVRPPPRDQPSPEETAELVAALRVAVEAGRRRQASTVVRGPDRSRWVRVVPAGERADVALEEQGVVLASRDVDTAWLVTRLGAGGGYAALLELLDA